MGASISCKSFYRVNTLNTAPREIKKIIIIYMVFYNAKLPKQDIYYIPVPRYILYLRNLAYIDGFKTYKNRFQNPETIFGKGGVCKSAIFDFIINLKSSI